MDVGLQGDASTDAPEDAGPDVSTYFEAGPACADTTQCTGGLVCNGGHCEPTVVVLASSSINSVLLTGSDIPSQPWVTKSATTDSSVFNTALTFDTTGRGVGAYVSTSTGLLTSIVWSNGAWAASSPISATAKLNDAPWVDATGGSTTHLVYQDTTNHFFYSSYSGTWSAPVAVGTATDKFNGPVAPTVAARGTNATIGFIDGESTPANSAAAGDLTSGAWQARVDVAAATPAATSIAPVIIPLSSGPELMMVFTQSASFDNQIVYATRTAGTWSAVTAIPNAVTTQRVGLAPLPGGGAILAFQGSDGDVDWSLYSGGAWSAVAPLSSPNASTTTPPAVTHGVAGDTAEIAYVGGSEQAAYHSRLIGGKWTTPVLIGGARMDGIAIAATP
jgi:hypothetical protein